MLSNLRNRLTFANVVSVVALFVALGGSSYAAIKVTGKNVPKDALTGADIKNLTGADVNNNSLTGADVKGLRSGDVTDRSLLSKDFAVGQLPAGPRGADGQDGTNGFGLLSYAFGTEEVANNGSDPGSAVPCPAGTFPTGGDAYAVNSSEALVGGVIVAQGINFDGSGTPDGYFAAWNNTSGGTVTVVVDAVCANASSVQSKAKAARVHARQLR